MLEPAHDLHVTRGRLTDRAISEPTVRAIARGAGGDLAELAFRFRGVTQRLAPLASGEVRHQLGLKLRAQDSCNVIYVMWCLEPSTLVVSIKHNPGTHAHRDRGAAGYTDVAIAAAPPLVADTSYRLRAEIAGDGLVAWIDGALIWRGVLPDTARELAGPAGLRTDNLALDRVELFVTSGPSPRARRGSPG